MSFANGRAVLASLLVAGPVFLQASPPPLLHLAEAERVALTRQPTMEQARAQKTAAEARKSSARAPLLPQLTATATYDRSRTAAFNRTTGATPTVTTADPSGIDIFAVGATANQLIWDFGQTYQKFRAADRLALSADALEKVTAQTVVLDVRRSYFTARAQKALAGVADDSLKNQERHLAQVEGFVRVGTRPEIDLAQSRTDVANARVQLINAENAYALSKAQLARAIGDVSGNDFEVADDELPAVAGEDSPADQVTASAMQTRRELVALERQRQGQELIVSGLKGGYGPTLSAHGTYQEIGTALGSLGPAWDVGLTLAWPIFQGGLTTGQVREAQANLDVTTAEVDGQKLQIAVEVRQALLSLRAAKAAEQATSDVVTNAKERLRLAEGRYAQGVGSIIELGDAQLAMTQANAQLVQAKFNVSSARADLLSAKGQR